jgi:hypothetical protein
MEDDKKKISFKYILPSDLKELHVNGAYGSLAPDGSIRMSVYSERPAIPNYEMRKINPDETLGEFISEEKKYPMVRVVQASLVFNAGTAKSFVRWLDDRIREFETFKAEIQKRSTEKG